MIKKLILVRSLPGSGKSTLTKQIKNEFMGVCDIFSTDDYWVRPDGIYDFNFELLSESHRWNQERVRARLSDNLNVSHCIIVDNTNITFNEMKPYIKMALEAGCDIEFVEPDTPWKYDVEECFKRNTHGVPYATILKMNQRWENHETVVGKLEELKSETV